MDIQRKLTGWVRKVGIGRVIALALLTGFCILRWWDPPPVEIARLKVFDTYLLLHPREPTARPVAIIDIDEESLAKIGQGPWPRNIASWRPTSGA